MASYFDIRGIPKILATLTVATLLTVTGTLKLPSGKAGGVLFLDSSKNASSTSRLQADGDLGTLSTSGTITSAGGNIITSAATANIVCNGLAANCTVGQSNGVGTLKTNSGGDTQLQTWNGTAFTDRIKIEGSQAIGEVSVFGSLFVSSTAASTFPAITATGTLRVANTASPTTTIEMTGRFCMKVLDMVGGTQRYITIASGSFVISTTDCR